MRGNSRARCGVAKMAADEEKKNRWLFTKEQLANSPSKAHGVDASKELSYRQQTANFIQDMGRRLNVTQLAINTAIVYMHRFFMHHSFKVYHRNNIAAAFLFLACKVEEQPRKLEHVVTVAYGCLHRGEPMIESSSEEYKRLTSEVIKHELLILQTLGFDVQIHHPHPDVVRCTQLVRASKDLAQTAYFMAHNSLLLTTMCLQYRPSIVACVCIHLACQWKGIEIPRSSDNKEWYSYIDDSVTPELLNVLAHEFVEIYESCPSRFRAKVDSKQQASSTDKSSKKVDDQKKFPTHMKHSSSAVRSDGSLSSHSGVKHDSSKPPSQKPDGSRHVPHSSSSQKLPHKNIKPPFTPQQLAAAQPSKPKLPKVPVSSVHEKSSSSTKEHTNHGHHETNSSSEEAKKHSLQDYYQKKAKQNELQQQSMHHHRQKRPLPPSGVDEHKAAKKPKESLTPQQLEALKREHYKRHHMMKQQQQQQSMVSHLPPLPPPLPKGSSGTTPPPPPPPS